MKLAKFVVVVYLCVSCTFCGIWSAFLQFNCFVANCGWMVGWLDDVPLFTAAAN